MPTAEEIIQQLHQSGNKAYKEQAVHFGVSAGISLGVSIPVLRKIARSISTDHALAQALWKTGIHEARILASMIDDPAKVTAVQIDRWTKDFDSWDVCDQVCGNLFDRTPFAVEKAIAYSSRKEEFVKRAGFVLMAEMSVHDKTSGDKTFLAFLPIIEREATDDRNFVKKAVNWALRQIGKRNITLRAAAIQTAERILQQDNTTARWIARDALKELNRPVKSR